MHSAAKHGSPVNLTRRKLLAYGGLTGMGLATLGIVGCGDDDESGHNDPNAGGQPDMSPTPVPKEGGNLVIGWASEPGNLDPATTTSSGTLEVLQFVGQYLMRDDPARKDGEPRHIIGDLATDWKFAEDGLSADFNLRPGVRFHDGTPFNADAVKFNHDFRRDDKNPFFMPTYKSITNTQLSNVKEVEVLSELTVRYRFLAPYPDWQEAVISTFPYGMFVSPTFVREKGQEDLAHGWPGTGPFKFKEYVPNQRVELVRNETYWGGRTLLDGVTFRIIPEDAARVAALRAGEVDLIIQLTADQATELDSVSNVTVLTGEDAVQSTMFANCNGALDIRIRKALNLSIDTTEACKEFFRGSCSIDTQYISPTSYAFESGLDLFPHDPKQAKDLMQAAGYKNEEITLLTGLANPFKKAEDEIIIDQWRKFGFNIKETRVEQSQFFARAAQGTDAEFQLMSSASAIAPPSQLDTWFHSKFLAPKGGNRSMYSQPDVDRMLDEARSTIDQAQRSARYRAVQRRIAQDSPMILTSYRNSQLAACSSTVMGLRLNILRWQNQDWVRVWLNR